MASLFTRFSSSAAVVRTASKPPRVSNVVVQRVQPQRRDVRAAFFNFGKSRTGADEAYPTNSSRSDYNADDVEHYFNYMGCLAVEGTYDRFEAMVKSGIEPVDIILLLAAAENDSDKIEELLAAGADPSTRDNLGRTPRELASKDVVVKMLEEAEAKLAKA